MNQPCVKFLSHTVSYIIFIIMLITSSIQLSNEQAYLEKFSAFIGDYFQNYTTYQNGSTFSMNMTYHFKLNDFFIRMHKPSELDVTLTIMIIGLTWQEIKKMYCFGFREYVMSWNNIVSAFMNILYLASFGLKYYTMIVVYYYRIEIKTNEFWAKVSFLENSNDIDDQKSVFQTFYWLNNGELFFSLF
jgi:hypothetical protein